MQTPKVHRAGDFPKRTPKSPAFGLLQAERQKSRGRWTSPKQPESPPRRWDSPKQTPKVTTPSTSPEARAKARGFLPVAGGRGLGGRWRALLYSAWAGRRIENDAKRRVCYLAFRRRAMNVVAAQPGRRRGRSSPGQRGTPMTTCAERPPSNTHPDALRAAASRAGPTGPTGPPASRRGRSPFGRPTNAPGFTRAAASRLRSTPRSRPTPSPGTKSPRLGWRRGATFWKPPCRHRRAYVAATSPQSRGAAPGQALSPSTHRGDRHEGPDFGSRLR